MAGEILVNRLISKDWWGNIIVRTLSWLESTGVKVLVNEFATKLTANTHTHTHTHTLHTHTHTHTHYTHTHTHTTHTHTHTHYVYTHHSPQNTLRLHLVLSLPTQRSHINHNRQ